MLFELLNPEWQSELSELKDNFSQLDQSLDSSGDYLPAREFIFRALAKPIAESKVVILGQDPYPNPKFACGLAFSISSETERIPASLQNILKEIESDVGGGAGHRGDLSGWHDQGVVLLNRVLTTKPWESNSHSGIGWEPITFKVVQVLSRRGALGLLWGKRASECATLFPPESCVQSAHPSPLSAHRGFLGSRPFSWVNSKLISRGLAPIDWSS